MRNARVGLFRGRLFRVERRKGLPNSLPPKDTAGSMGSVVVTQLVVEAGY
jgi:hypothetical protein